MMFLLILVLLVIILSGISFIIRQNHYIMENQVKPHKLEERIKKQRDKKIVAKQMKEIEKNL